MCHEIIQIKFSEFDGPLFSGRQRGINSRIKAKLDDIDNSNIKVSFIMPDDLLTITSSFFLGMFDKSITKYPNKKDFFSKYSFKNLPESIYIQMNDWFDRVLLNMHNKV